MNHSSPAVPFYDEATIAPVLRFEDLIPAMERALSDFSAGRVTQPVRSIVPIAQQPGALMGLMPVIYGDLLGTKLVNVYPGNAERGLPTHQAIIAVFRGDTGEPLALMDGRLITEMRTAAVSAVAAKLLSSPGAKSLAILGSGVQARAHVQALRHVRPLSEIRVWSRTRRHAEECASEIGGVATSTEEAVRSADIVVTVTNSPEPVLHGRWLKPGALVLAVGAVGPKRRELDDDAVMRGVVIVDSREAAKVEAGDILIPNAPIYAELGELLNGTLPLPQAEITVFKSLGIAVEDLAAARLVLDRLSQINE